MNEQGIIPRKAFFLFLLTTIFLIFILAGCKNERNPAPQPSSKDESSLIKEKSTRVQPPTFKPIQIDDGAFNTISGWLDNDTILYITDSSSGSNVHSHNLHNGENKLLFESSFPIVSVLISPLREYFLVHSSPSTNEALITVYTKDGQQVLEKKIPSTEVNIEWNLYNESSILITAFTEDWEFTVWNLNCEEATLLEVSLPQPFGYWLKENELLYLDWDLETPSLYANLKKYNLLTSESSDVLSQVLQVDTFKDIFMTVEVEEENNQNAAYTFFSNDNEELLSFETPHLSNYSDWLIPYYDYNLGMEKFITYQPLYYGEADTYADGFHLIAYDIKTGESSVLLEGLENEPLSCSPDGEKCLSGFYLEKLIHLESKEIVSIANIE